MTDELEFESVYLIRRTGGESHEIWLSNIHVLNGGQRVDSPTWAAILEHPDTFTFLPEFLSEESAAYKMISRDIAERLVRVLANYGIDAEVIEKECRGK